MREISHTESHGPTKMSPHQRTPTKQLREEVKQLEVDQELKDNPKPRLNPTQDLKLVIKQVDHQDLEWEVELNPNNRSPQPHKCQTQSLS